MRRDSKRAGRRFGILTLAIVPLLALASFLERGYQFGTWPQIVPLERIMRMQGEIPGDWVTSRAPLHWAFDHFWSLVPASAIEPGFAWGWAVALLLFWFGYARIGRDLGLGAGAILGAGLIGSRTAFAGFGATSMLGPMLSPSNLGDVGWLLAAREALIGNSLRSGFWTGLAMLIHPRVGALALATGSAVTAGVGGLRRGARVTGLRAAAALPGVRRAAGLVVVALAIGGIAIYRAMVDFGAQGAATSGDAAELLIRMRLAHHLDYSAFPLADYATTAAWTLALVFALFLAGPTPWRRAWITLTLALAALCAVGAIASAIGGPGTLIQLHTARASNWAALLATLAAADVLTRRRPIAGAIALLCVPAIGEALRPLLQPALASLGLHGVPSHAFQALVLMAIMPTVKHWPTPYLNAPLRSRLALALGVLLVPVGFIASGWHGPPRAAIDPEWRDIAERARRVSGAADIIATPPDLAGFRLYSHRAIVVDFDNTPPDALAGWIERVNALTGDAGALDARLAVDLASRVRRIGESYDRHVLETRSPLERYGARFVVAREGARAPIADTLGAGAPIAGTSVPAWLERVDSNRRYVIYRVRTGTAAP